MLYQYHCEIVCCFVVVDRNHSQQLTFSFMTEYLTKVVECSIPSTSPGTTSAVTPPMSRFFYYPFKFLTSCKIFVRCPKFCGRGFKNFTAAVKFLQELIPELFYLPEMLTNHNKVNRVVVRNVLKEGADQALNTLTSIGTF